MDRDGKVEGAGGDGKDREQRDRDQRDTDLHDTDLHDTDRRDRNDGERIHVRGAAATVSLVVLSLASVLGVAALLVGRGPAETVFAAVCAVFPPALIALGATRRGSCDRTVVVTALALFAVLAGAFLLLFHYRGAGANVPTLGAVPVPVAVLLGGVWLLPLVFVGLVYALTFERHGVGGEDLERLRRLAAGREVAEDGEGQNGEGQGGEARAVDPDAEGAG